MKAAIGLNLVVIPMTVIRAAGLQRPEIAFWPRLLGATTLAIAAGIWLGLQFPNAHGGIGPAGLVPVNLASAAAILAPLVMGHAAPTRRGRLILAACALGLLALAFIEIAHV